MFHFCNADRIPGAAAMLSSLGGLTGCCVRAVEG